MTVFERWRVDWTLPRQIVRVTRDAPLRFLHRRWVRLVALGTPLLLGFLLADLRVDTHVRVAVGSPAGAYSQIGQAYAGYFAARGARLDLIYTHGAVDNARLLESGQVDAALVQSGVLQDSENPAGPMRGPAQASPRARSLLLLGSIDYAPLWFFRRAGVAGPDDDRLELDHLGRLCIGAPGSATNLQARRVLTLGGMAGDAFRTDRILERSSGDCLGLVRQGAVDGLFVTDTVDSPSIRMLASDPDLRLMGFDDAEAFRRQDRSFDVVTLPAGGFDIARNFPGQPVQLLASTVDLVVAGDMPAGLQYLFMQAAEEISGKESYFAAAGEFPSFKHSNLPHSAIATEFVAGRSSWILRCFPFWLGGFLIKLLATIMPCLALVLPLLGYVPGMTRWLAARKIERAYVDLRRIEMEFINREGVAGLGDFQRRIEEIQHRVGTIKVPNKLLQDYYCLRTNLAFVCERLQADAAARRSAKMPR